AETARPRLERVVHVERVDARARHEAHGGVEVAADALAAPGEVPAVVGVVERDAGREVRLAGGAVVRPHAVDVEAEVLVASESRGGEARVRTEQAVLTRPRRIAPRGEGADPRLLEQVPADAHCEEVLRGQSTLVQRRLARLD